jgi:hypothetical protein
MVGRPSRLSVSRLSRHHCDQSVVVGRGRQFGRWGHILNRLCNSQNDKNVPFKKREIFGRHKI